MYASLVASHDLAPPSWGFLSVHQDSCWSTGYLLQVLLSVAYKGRVLWSLTPALHGVAAAAGLGKLSLFLQGADNITGQITQVVVIQFVYASPKLFSSPRHLSAAALHSSFFVCHISQSRVRHIVQCTQMCFLATCILAVAHYLERCYFGSTSVCCHICMQALFDPDVC